MAKLPHCDVLKGDGTKMELRIRISKENKKEFLDKMEILGFATQGDFVMMAIRTLYDVNYMNNEAQVIPTALQQVLESTIKSNIKSLTDRLAKNISATAITQSMILKILEAEFTLTDDEMQNARVEAVEELKNKAFIFKQENHRGE